jgi:hypothetical protein
MCELDDYIPYSTPLSLASCLVKAIYGHPEVSTPAMRGGCEETTQKMLNDVGYRLESESVHRALPGLRQGSTKTILRGDPEYG